MTEYFTKTSLLGKRVETNLLNRTGLDFRCIPFVEGKTVGFAVFYNGILICNVSFLAKDGVETFFPLSEAEIDDAVDAFLAVDGMAA